MTLLSCQKDNFDGPDSSVYGGVIDSKTGELIEQDMLNGSRIEVYEHGYSNPTAMYWDFMISGNYRNNLVFSNTYDFYLRDGNYFPIEMLDVNIKKGENKIDFKVVPYLRIINYSIDYSQQENKVTATFSIEAGSDVVKLKRIRLYSWSDQYVGEPFKFDINNDNDVMDFNPTINPDNTVYTLSIDLKKNSDIFKSGRNYYFRVGALADVQGQGTIKYNYVPFSKITLK